MVRVHSIGRLRSLALGAAALAATAFAASGAQAAVTVLGDGLAHLCSVAAISGVADDNAIKVCTLSIENEMLIDRDRSGTFVNRGVMLLHRQQFAAAKSDFDTAVKTDPKLGEAYVDRGAALVAMHRYADGIVDLEKGLGLVPEEPEKAYYNRALAREGMGDIKGAYFDYRKAVELKPDWEDPQRELTRFTVRTVGPVGS